MCPDYLQLQEEDILTLATLSVELSTHPEIDFLPAELAKLSGTLRMTSTVGRKDRFFRPSKRAYGSSVHKLFCAGMMERQNVVVKFTYPRREGSMTTEPAFSLGLRLSDGIKSRLSVLLMYGRAQVDEVDPFEAVFVGDLRYRLPVLAVFEMRQYHLYALGSWHLSLVIADVIFLVFALWEKERVMHRDISIGNVCSRLDSDHFINDKQAILGRFERGGQGIAQRRRRCRQSSRIVTQTSSKRSCASTLTCPIRRRRPRTGGSSWCWTPTPFLQNE